MDWLIPLTVIFVITASTVLVITLRPRDLLRTVQQLSQQVRELAEQVGDANANVRKMEAEAAANRGEIRQLEARVYDAVRLISRLVDGIKQLTQQITNDGGVPVWEIPSDAKLLLEVAPQKKRRSVELRLAQHLGEAFNEDELRGFCLELETAVGQRLDYENLPGSMKQAKAQSLVRWADNRGFLPDLARVGQQLRPLLDWSL